MCDHQTWTSIYSKCHLGALLTFKIARQNSFLHFPWIETGCYGVLHVSKSVKFCSVSDGHASKDEFAASSGPVMLWVLGNIFFYKSH